MSSRLYPDKMAFELNYQDQSGVAYAVRLDKSQRADDCTEGLVELEHITTVEFPLHKLEWLIDALRQISYEVRDEIPSP